ncbi:hypothetical protein NQZ68_008582 [Dissostichus eleginoides]|nr:hypothetical protein NQZ68_008582 [Dissostichus eleginoides]
MALAQSATPASSPAPPVHPPAPSGGEPKPRVDTPERYASCNPFITNCSILFALQARPDWQSTTVGNSQVGPMQVGRNVSDDREVERQTVGTGREEQGGREREMPGEGKPQWRRLEVSP